MADIQKLIAEMRKLKPLSPEWHAKAEEIERAFGWPVQPSPSRDQVGRVG